MVVGRCVLKQKSGKTSEIAYGLAQGNYAIPDVGVGNSALFPNTGRRRRIRTN